MAGRQARDQCTGHRKDGRPCQARAIPGGLVCPLHGGSAPQVRMAARRLVLLEAQCAAWEDFKAAQGTRRERAALYRACDATNELEAYERDLALIAALRLAVKAQRSGVPVASMTAAQREALAEACRLVLDRTGVRPRNAG